eukprot:TRINITY_DN14726_c0_g1_i3.p1 TRINITY_DN14726_c0_g1~~TRINITY_DN14726_c0_g1_i3.p1  ORF type:complete len:220 (-),score=30.98 TRINITY_DN14726_c0_g1_i3:116-775(-)
MPAAVASRRPVTLPVMPENWTQGTTLAPPLQSVGQVQLYQSAPAYYTPQEVQVVSVPQVVYAAPVATIAFSQPSPSVAQVEPPRYLQPITAPDPLVVKETWTRQIVSRGLHGDGHNGLTTSRFPYHDPQRGFRWKGHADDAFDEQALLEEDLDRPTPLMELRHAAYLKAHEDQFLYKSQAVASGYERGKFPPVARRVREPAQGTVASGYGSENPREILL